jgi:hypothetical protein
MPKLKLVLIPLMLVEVLLQVIYQIPIQLFDDKSNINGSFNTFLSILGIQKYYKIEFDEHHYDLVVINKEG